MGRYFFDTSALVKRYHEEQGTDAIDALFAVADSSFVISRLGIVEMVLAQSVSSTSMAHRAA
jgi:predicted nucleic acid-binding protein